MKKQQGLSLVIVLVFLMILMLGAVSLLREANTHQQMANNYEEMGVSFQAAETLLRQVENELSTTQFSELELRGSCSGSQCFTSNCKLGLCLTVNYPEKGGDNCEPLAEKVWEINSNWNRAPERTVTLDRELGTGGAQIEVVGKALIEFRCYTPKIQNTTDYFQLSEWSEYYRITVRVEGPSGQSPTLLQSHFRRN